MTKAEVAAWDIFIARLKNVVTVAQMDFEAHRHMTATAVFPPTSEHVAIIQRAIDDSVREVRESAISAVLGPVCRALDALDNSRTKSETVKAARADIQKAYDELHALKAELACSSVHTETP